MNRPMILSPSTQRRFWGGILDLNHVRYVTSRGAQALPKVRVVPCESAVVHVGLFTNPGSLPDCKVISTHQTLSMRKALFWAQQTQGKKVCLGQTVEMGFDPMLI